MLKLFSKLTLSLGIILLIGFITHAGAEEFVEYVEVVESSDEDVTNAPGNTAEPNSEGTTFTKATTKSSSTSTPLPTGKSTGKTSMGASTTTAVKTTIPPTTKPITFTVYARITEEEFDDNKEDIIKTLVEVLNSQGSSSGTFKAYAVSSQLTYADISIVVRQLDNGYLKIDITVRNTNLTSEEAKKIVMDNKDKFNDILMLEGEVPGAPTKGGLKDWEIALIVLGTLAVVMAIAGGAVYYIKRKKSLLISPSSDKSALPLGQY